MKSDNQNEQTSYKVWKHPFSWDYGGANGEESACQCRRHGFDPWVGKIPERKKWQPTPVFLPGEFHGQRSLVSHRPWGCKESEATEHTHTQMELCRGTWNKDGLFLDFPYKGLP